MTPMYVHVVQTVVSEGMYRQWCHLVRIPVGLNTDSG